MSDNVTKKMIELYDQEAPRGMFLTSFARTPRENFHESEEVEVDVVRNNEDIAPVITNLAGGPNLHSEDTYTNKKFTPPVLNDAFPLNGFDMIKRQPGENPFMQPEYRMKAVRKIFRGFRKIQAKQQRTIEYMASQVLQTGILNLANKDGVNVYAIDYKPKATHFPTVSTSWSDPSADIMGDLRALSNVIRSDGLVRPVRAILGQGAFANLMKNTTVQQFLDNRRYEIGRIAPAPRNADAAILQGILQIGDSQLELWTYDGWYEPLDGGAKTRYIGDDKVVLISDQSRFDLTMGSIPLVVSPDPRVANLIPRQIVNPAAGYGFTTNIWVTPDNRTIMAESGGRPLFIPTGIDTYGCLTTTAA